MAKKSATKSTAKAKPATAKAKAEKPAKKAVVKAEKPKKEAAHPETVEMVEEAPVEKPAKAAKAEKPPKVKKATKAEIARAELISDEAKKWVELKEKFGKDKAPHYSMSAVYEAQTPIHHKVLGWGFVMTNNNDRLEVLFEAGKKVLISNYNPK